MSLSHLGRAVQFICSAKKTTAMEIANNAGLHSTLLSRTCNGSRLEARSLRALCTSQPDPRDNTDLLIAHLRDEIERAGHSTHEIDIRADTSRLDDELQLLLEEAKHDAQLAGILRQLAAFVRTHPMSADNVAHYPVADEALAVAEEQAPYAATPSEAENILQARAAGKATPAIAPTPPPPASAKGKR